MEPAVLGLVVDSSVLVAAERSRVTTPEVIGAIREAVGDVAIVICSLTVAELAHGIYRAQTPRQGRGCFRKPLTLLGMMRAASPVTV
jgi:predicted nucleic acid-binding protein